MDLLLSLNIWAVLVAATLHFLLGAVWYSVLFPSVWMKLRGITEADIGEPNPMTFVWTFLLQLVSAGTLGVILLATGIDTAHHGALVGFGAGAGLVFTLTGTTGLFSDSNIGLHFIDNGYHVLGLTIAGAVLGAW